MSDERHANVEYVSTPGADRVGAAVPPPAGGPADDAVPEGGVRDIEQWVGTDLVRAQRALDAENARSDPRSSLVNSLERLLGT